MEDQAETTVDPALIPGTPQAVAKEAGAPGAPEGSFVDCRMRKRVTRQLNSGIVSFMGPDFPGCRIKIKPWSNRNIQISRETYELTLRARTPMLKRGDPLPAPETIELNRATGMWSVMGLEGTFQVSEKDFLKFSFPEKGDDEELEKQRRFISKEFLVPYEPERPESGDECDMVFLGLLMSLNDGISKVVFQEIDKLGKNFVFGAAGSLDWLG